MTEAELRELVAARALDALEPDERLAFDDALALLPADHPLHAELARARETVASLADLLPAEPASEPLWQRIADEARATPRTGDESSSQAAEEADGPRNRGNHRDSAARRSPRRRSGIAWGFALAAGVAATVLGVDRVRLDDLLRRESTAREQASAEQARLQLELADTRRLLAAAESRASVAQVAESERAACQEEHRRLQLRLAQQVAALGAVQQPDAQVLALAAQGGAPYRATAVLDQAGQRGWLLTSGPEAPAGRDLQLWLIRGDRKISAGLLPTGGDPVLPIDPTLLAEGPPDAVAVTVEPQGGVAQPTGPIVLLARVPRA